MKLQELFTPRWLAKLDPARSDVYRFLHAMLVDSDGREGWAQRQRRRMSECLEIARRHELIDDNFLRRLRSPDPGQFWGKLNELTAARFFDAHSIRLSFNPPGRKRHEGEFLLEFPAPIFVEVKTMLPRPPDAATMRCLAILCDEVRKIDAPAWVTVEVKLAPKQAFARKPFRDYIASAINNAGQTAMTSWEYVDCKSGLVARVVVVGDLAEGPMEASPFIGPIQLQNDAYVRETVKHATRQLPPDQPCLVLLFEELTFPLHPRHFLNALYGTLQIHIGQPGTEPRASRMSDGLLRPRRHTRVSAVGYFDTPGERNHPDPILQLYHHPQPKSTLSYEDFSRLTRKQIVPMVEDRTSYRRWELSQPYDDFAFA